MTMSDYIPPSTKYTSTPIQKFMYGSGGFRVDRQTAMLASKWEPALVRLSTSPGFTNKQNKYSKRSFSEDGSPGGHRGALTTISACMWEPALVRLSSGKDSAGTHEYTLR